MDALIAAREMRALVWTDVDLEKGQLRNERNEWQGHISTIAPVSRKSAGALEHGQLRLRPTATRVTCGTCEDSPVGGMDDDGEEPVDGSI